MCALSIFHIQNCVKIPRRPNFDDDDNNNIQRASEALRAAREFLFHKIRLTFQRLSRLSLSLSMLFIIKVRARPF